VTAGEGSTRRRDRIGRTLGRTLALQMLYSFEQNHYADDGNLVTEEVTAEVGEEAAQFARSLFDGFRAERAPVDAAVDQRLENWSIQRLAVIDRAILRLGAFELLYRADTPPKAAINEWIEIAKAYGSEAKTPKLVNGVLDRIARDHAIAGLRAEPARASPADPAPGSQPL
jgi:N utilization substance protein B